LTEPREPGPIDPQFGLLAERAIEVLVTHNEPVTCEDLACALGVTDARVWGLASRLRTLGYATLDERNATVEATALATDPSDQPRRDALLRALDED
jgi:DNA-binding IclR family transcriptional regulator